ncbi:hypothetical protein HDU78_004730 [Chytriomyces hyalinus]|nr:hypothetical protein HDU78_004730 [Chytriomyces hyalinus]
MLPTRPPLPAAPSKQSSVQPSFHAAKANVLSELDFKTINNSFTAAKPATTPRTIASTSRGPVLKMDAHDARSNNIISISRGPPQDPQFFYSTIYSTTHKASHNPLLSNPINGIHASDLRDIKVKQRSGYSKNLAPCVDYDKAVDESDTFRITDPYLTATSDHYTPPPKSKDYLANPKAGLAPMVDSGFTRRPLYNVTQDGSSKYNRDKRTLMKASYPDGHLIFKPSKVTKSTILPSATAYISDEGEIKALGNVQEVPETERFAPDPLYPPKSNKPPWECTMPEIMRLDGYSRSTRPKDPLQTDHGVMPEIDSRLLEHASLDKLKHVNLAEWVHRVDIKAEESFSRVVHPPMDHKAHMRCISEKNVRIGLKEPTGGVQNNPKFVFNPEPDPKERFLTETARRFQSPVKPNQEPVCNTLVKSGFSDGNRYAYVHNLPTDGQIYSKMHPTVAKYNWLSEKGLHTNRPNKMHAAYTLKVE